MGAAPALTYLRSVALATDVERAILARERAALRRLGILAGSAAPIVVFEAMAQELARIADLSTGTTRVDMAAVVHYDKDEIVVVAAWGESDALPAPVGSRWPLDGDSVSARVHRSRRPTRIEVSPHRDGWPLEHPTRSSNGDGLDNWNCLLLLPSPGHRSQGHRGCFSRRHVFGSVED